VKRGIGRIIAAGGLGAFAGAAWLALWYGIHPALRIEFDVDPPRRVSGVYPPERDDRSGLSFAWTGADMALRLPGLDRSVDWVLDIRVRGGRATDNPLLEFRADGELLSSAPSGADFQNIEVRIPARRDRPYGLTISMRVSSTVVPGPGDTRALGVMLDRINLRPSGVVLPPRAALSGAAVAGAALGAANAALGMTAGSAIGAALLLAAAQGAILARGYGPYTDFPAVTARLAIAIAVALLLLTGAARWIRAQPFRNTARFAIAFSAGALFLKVMVLLHPDMPVGDAMFQAHRFQTVLTGNLFFTSVAPGGYLFPYAPGLYVFSAPFAPLVRGEYGYMALLRVVTSSAEAAAGLCLYWMIVRAWGDRLAGALAVGVYHLIPLQFGVTITGNLTNAFAQSVAVAALAVLTAGWLRWERRWAVVLLTLLFAAAFMSHTGTFAILGATAIGIAALFVWRGGPVLRSPAGAVFAAALMALALSVGLYYADFADTYRSELARLGAETRTAAPDAGGRGIGARLFAVPGYLHTYLGVPALLLAGWGAARLWQKGLRDKLTLSLAGWAAACLAFLTLGILTPIDMRYYLASVPAVAIAAAVGGAAGWTAGGTPRILAAGLLGWVVWLGVHTWWNTLG